MMDGKWLIIEDAKTEFYEDFEIAKTVFLKRIQDYLSGNNYAFYNNIPFPIGAFFNYYFDSDSITDEIFKAWDLLNNYSSHFSDGAFPETAHYKYIGKNDIGECVSIIVHKNTLKEDYYMGEKNYYLHTNILSMKNPYEVYEFDSCQNILITDSKNQDSLEKSYSLKLKLGYLKKDDIEIQRTLKKEFELGLPVFEYCDDDLSDELKEKAKYHKFKE